MDQNFSDILGIFKRLDEGSMKEQMWRDAERMTREQFCSKWGNEHAEFWDNIMGELDEGSMADAEKHQSGSHFGGYWKGTDKNPPKPGQGVGGGCEEGIEQECDANISPLEAKLRARWKQTKAGLQEYGMTTGGTPMSTTNTNPAQSTGNQQADAEALKKLTNIVGQAKNKGILPRGASTPNTTQAIAANPALNKATGQQKQELGAVAANLNAAMQKAAKNPSAQSDLNTAMSALQRIQKAPG